MRIVVNPDVDGPALAATLTERLAALPAQTFRNQRQLVVDLALQLGAKIDGQFFSICKVTPSTLRVLPEQKTKLNLTRHILAPQAVRIPPQSNQLTATEDEMTTKPPKDAIGELMQNQIKNSLWRTPPPSEQPNLSLARWSVMETQTGDHHLVGYNLDDREGRVSTAIVAFDPGSLKATTRSGRIYQLVGGSGYDSDGAWVWDNWSRANRFSGKDVTDQYEKKIAKAAAPPKTG